MNRAPHTHLPPSAADRPPARALVVRIGACDEDALAASPGEPPARLWLVDGNPDAAEGWADALRAAPWARTVQAVVTLDGAPVTWHRYSLARFDGTDDPAGRLARFPRLRLVGSAPTPSVALDVLLARLRDDPEAGGDGWIDELVLDGDGLGAAALAQRPSGLLDRIRRVRVRDDGGMADLSHHALRRDAAARDDGLVDWVHDPVRRAAMDAEAAQARALAALADREAELASARDEAGRLQAICDTLQTTCDTLQAELADCREALRATDVQRDGERAAAQADTQAAAQRLLIVTEDAQRRLAAAEAAQVEAAARVVQLETARVEAAARIVELEAALSARIAEHDADLATRAALQAELMAARAALAGERAAGEASLAAARREAEAAVDTVRLEGEVAVEALRRELAEVSAGLTAATGRERALQGQVAELTSVVEKVRAERDEHALWHRKNADWAQGLKVTVDGLTAERDALLAERDRLRADLTAATARESALREQVAGLDAAVAQVRAERDQQTHWHHKNAEWARGLQGRLDTLNAEHAALGTRHDALQAELRTLVDVRDALVERLQGLEAARATEETRATRIDRERAQAVEEVGALRLRLHACEGALQRALADLDPLHAQVRLAREERSRLEARAAEREARQALMDTDLVKVEARLALLQEVLLRADDR